MVQLNFDATQVEPDAGFETVPAGWYNVAMDESSLKPTKDGAGAYLEARFNILDGQYHGRKLFARLNLQNSNQQTVEIAMKQLSAIGHAVGVLHIQDSSQLHGLPLKVKVKIRPASGDYEASNDITAYKNINEQVDMAGAPPAGAPPASFGAPPASFGAPASGAGAAPSLPAGFGASAAPAAPAPAAPAAPAAPPPVAAAPSGLEAAVADGWIKHPDTAGYHYKGQEVKKDDEVAALYPATSAAPAAPSAPAAPAAAQPWAAAPAAALAATPAATTAAAPQEAHPAQSAVPPWATPSA